MFSSSINGVIEFIHSFIHHNLLHFIPTELYFFIQSEILKVKQCRDGCIHGASLVASNAGETLTFGGDIEISAIE